MFALVLFAMLVAAGCSSPPPADVLLFNGTGASENDVRAIEDLLHSGGIRYELANSAELDAMSSEQLRTHRLLIIPGGNFEMMGNNLAPATSANVRGAVNGGLNYLGICAGAFIAGDSPYNGINLTGVRFPFYSISNQGVRKAAVPISSPAAPVLEHYWEDGPELSGWGEAIAKYPDGSPAVAQGRVGDGWVILSGTHPEAPESWRESMAFTTPSNAANAYAMQLIEAALAGRPLPHF
jgi:glutamine amidotransferase-like uncharacterized protein